eukprot:Gb_19587 [translate_table: standard]
MSFQESTLLQLPTLQVQRPTQTKCNTLHIHNAQLAKHLIMKWIEAAAHKISKSCMTLAVPASSLVCCMFYSVDKRCYFIYPRKLVPLEAVTSEGGRHAAHNAINGLHTVHSFSGAVEFPCTVSSSGREKQKGRFQRSHCFYNCLKEQGFRHLVRILLCGLEWSDLLLGGNTVGGAVGFRLSEPFSNGSLFQFKPLMQPPEGQWRVYDLKYTWELALLHVKEDVVSNVTNMQMRGVSTEGFRVSVSSAPSSSSQGSGQDDCDALGDVYIWGKNICDGFLGGITDKIGNALGTKIDSLLPKALESTVVLDAHRIACGGRHAALLTRQGELFTWGEVSGGRLGHGVGSDVSLPQLVETLANCRVESIACGEYHTCAITYSGELYTWGDGIHNIGLLGHGNNVSHWVPNKVHGPLDGVQIHSIACGQWHTALITSAGQLFTFGDGTFGVLGHGDCTSVSYPREVESLKGLKTLRAACGAWHTAAVIEVMVGYSSASNCASGKLFTWGDGESGRLGHGDEEKKLVPTCVPSLIDYNFRQVACGHRLTVALTTSGQVLTMGSAIYGQLGNPQSDGNLPCLVEEKLTEETVEEIACGAYHVAVLTAKAEVYTWGKGANGRLGHGDVGDQKTPTLVEALKDKQVKSIACGSNFTAAVCIHKWVSGADQSVCSGCRQSFGFTRKRHNCYHCGLVYCHSCSSKKALKAAMAPNPNKPHRVCDSCLSKLKKASEVVMVSNTGKAIVLHRHPNDTRDKAEKPETKVLKSLWLPSLEPFKQLEGKPQTKRGKKSETLSSSRDDQNQSFLQFKGFNYINSLDHLHGVTKTLTSSLQHSRNISRAVSPFSRRSSPPRSTTPTPTMTGLALPLSGVDDLKKKNEVLTREVLKLRALAENLTQQCQLQEAELQQTAKQAREALTLAGEESAKCKAAKEVIKSLTAQEMVYFFGSFMSIM